MARHETLAMRDPTIEQVTASAWTIPTDAPESDGTLEWDATTIVVVEARGGGETGLGYTYAPAPAAGLVAGTLAPVVTGSSAFEVRRAWDRMVARVRNAGRAGLAAEAISAVDVALWDLKARLLGLPLATLLDATRDSAPLYGSGGFTSYPDDRLVEQLSEWAEQGLAAVKMKVGRTPAADGDRVATVRRALGPSVDLMVDANGAYSRQQAVEMGEVFRGLGVTWYEEPVSSDDLDGLRFVRQRSPAGLEIAAGEYGYDPWYFRTMLAKGAVDVLQADATRCLGYTGFLAAAELARAHHTELSAHTAPQLHAHVAVAVPALRHVEYFHDHARLEPVVFDGVLTPRQGALHPDRSRPGHGLTLKRADADRAAA